MITLADFRATMRPLIRHWKQEAPETLEDWQDYYAILGHLTIEVLAAAVLKVMATHIWPTFPKPAVILNAGNDIAAPRFRSGEEAWGDVLHAIAEFGYLHGPGDGWSFKDLRVAAVVNLMGWRRICLDEDETIQWQFIHAYKALAERETSEARELPAVSAVRAQTLNVASAPLPVVSLIGDTAKKLAATTHRARDDPSIQAGAAPTEGVKRPPVVLQDDKGGQ